MPPRIGVAVPYFGPFPPFAPYFFRSAAANRTVDFHIYTDQPRPSHAEVGVSLDAPNIHWHRSSFPDFAARLAAALGLLPEDAARYPYKLCDYKSTFGAALRDDLGAYDFWATCDIDLVFGDVRAFLTDTWLADHDFWAAPNGWYRCGAFQLYRTDHPATTLFQRTGDWEAALASPEYAGLDECGFHWDPDDRLGAPPNLTDTVEREREAGRLRTGAYRAWRAEPGPRWQGLRFFQTDIEWHHGALTDRVAGRALLYVHFVHAKKTRYFRVPEGPVPDRFYIRPYGLSPTPPGAPLRRAAEFTRMALRTAPGALAGSLRRRVGALSV